MSTKLYIKVNSANVLTSYVISNELIVGYTLHNYPDDLALVDGKQANLFELYNGRLRLRPEEANTKEELLGYLASIRYRYEQGGCFWNDTFIPTDDRSQVKYSAEMIAIQDGSRVDGSPWKFPNGFQMIDNQEMIDMCRTVRAWVLNCFGAESEVAVLIENGSITTTIQIDDAMAERLA